MAGNFDLANMNSWKAAAPFPYLPGNSNDNNEKNAYFSYVLDFFICVKQPLAKQTSWIQCDECSKWRRVSKGEADSVTDETKWYCHMNKDAYHNKCKDAEENCESAEELAKKYGVKYITSPLPDGTLVWAKMDGYCRWPAIICQDPNLGESAIRSVDGDTLSYHVEFLGKKHCHSFVKVALVTTYTQRAQQCEMSPNFPVDLKNKIRKSNKGFKRNSVNGYSVKLEYQGGTVEEAIEEANKLFVLPMAERLKSVIYRPKVMEKENSVDEGSAKSTREKELNGEVEEVPTGFRTPTMSPQMASLHLKTCFSSPAMSDRSGKRKRYAEGKGLSASLMHRSKEEKFALDLQAYQHNEKAFEHDLKRYWERMNQPLKKLPTWEGEPVKLFTLFSAVNERGGYSKVSGSKGGWQKIYQETTNTNTLKQGVKAKKFYMRCLLPFEMYLHGKDYEEYVKFLESTDDRVARRVLETTTSRKSMPPSVEKKGTSHPEKQLAMSESTERMERRRKVTPTRHKPLVSSMEVDFPYQFSATPIFKPKKKTKRSSRDENIEENIDDDWKKMEQILKEIPTFFENERAEEWCDQNHHQDRGYFSEAASESVADINVPVQKPVGATQMNVVFYDNDTPQFHRERPWMQERQSSDRPVTSEFNIRAPDAQKVPPAMESERMFSDTSDEENNDQVLREMEALQEEMDDIHNQLMVL